jgi:excinuclease ABC subunit A
VDLLGDLRRHGFNRLYQEDKIYEFSTPESLLNLDFAGDVFVLVDRIMIRSDVRQRLMDSLESCYREGNGQAVVEIVALPEWSTPESGPLLQEVPRYQKLMAHPKPGDRFNFSEKFKCHECSIVYEEPEPRLFSFNSPFGACPSCQGFGNTIDFDLNLVVPDKDKSLQQGGIEPWTKPRYRAVFAELKRFAKQHGIPLDSPYRSLSAAQKDLIYHGDEKFIGIKRFFEHLETKKYKLYIRVFLSRYRGYALCQACAGSRLRPDARAVKISGQSISDITALTVENAYCFFKQLALTAFEAAVAQRILTEIRTRLQFLYNVGLEYLTLDRLASTLSGGESRSQYGVGDARR